MTFYLSLLPSRNSVRAGEPLNVLLLARSNGADSPQLFRFWVRGESADGAGWQLALEEERALRPNHNEHLYFQIPSAAFDGQEEVTLAAGDAPPVRDNKLCKLITVLP